MAPINIKSCQGRPMCRRMHLASDYSFAGAFEPTPLPPRPIKSVSVTEALANPLTRPVRGHLQRSLPAPKKWRGLGNGGSITEGMF